MLNLGIGISLGNNTAALSGGGGGGGAWAPSSLGTNLVANWTNLAPANLTKSGGGTVVDGDTVATITDPTSGAVLSVAGTGALYHTDGTHNWLTFGGAGGYETTATVTLTDGSGQHSSWSTVKPTSTSGLQGVFCADAGSGNRIAHLQRINSGPVDSVALDITTTGFTDTGPSVSTASAQVLSEITSASAIEAFVDNVGNGSTAITNTLQTGASKIQVGLLLGSNFFSGNWYGSLVAKSAVGSTDRTGAQTYMRALAP